ncbi:MAG: hypothetical protein QOC99_2948 [Acidobacteriota bacterium]|nr:hypothetical protein [Acidobacteriota bacterium]
MNLDSLDWAGLNEMNHVQKYVGALAEIFRNAPDKHEANRRSRVVLEDMSGDAEFLTCALARQLRAPGSLNSKHYPVVGFNVDLNAQFGLVVNCWIPLPDRKADISTKAIHHHGDMLLSTVNAFGPGYEHWTFTRPQLIDEARERYEMRLVERTPHPLGHVAFVDSYVPHLPFYPTATSITYALWTSRFPVTWKDRIKRIPALQKNSAALRSLAARAGLARKLELKVVEYFDFYPTAEGFRGIRERTEFERGPNEDYLYSLFHILQATGNDGLAKVVEERLASDEQIENPQLVRRLVEDLRRGRPIEGRLSATHYGVPRANFTRVETERALAAQQVPATSNAPAESNAPATSDASAASNVPASSDAAARGAAEV